MRNRKKEIGIIFAACLSKSDKTRQDQSQKPRLITVDKALALMYPVVKASIE